MYTFNVISCKFRYNGVNCISTLIKVDAPLTFIMFLEFLRDNFTIKNLLNIELQTFRIFSLILSYEGDCVVIFFLDFFSLIFN